MCSAGCAPASSGTWPDVLLSLYDEHIMAVSPTCHAAVAALPMLPLRDFHSMPVAIFRSKVACGAGRIRTCIPIGFAGQRVLKPPSLP